MDCIFICIFNQEKYVEMFYLLLESILIYGKLTDNTDILIYTSTPFMRMIKQSDLFNARIKFEINDNYDNIEKACKARLDLFNLQSMNGLKQSGSVNTSPRNYNKILYLDTDILIKGDINQIFNLCKDDILYVLEEGHIDGNKDYWGKSLFGDEIYKYTDKSAFTSGILLFNNCKKIKDLFNHINKDFIDRPNHFSCHDQPYIIYNAFKYNLYNNKILKPFVINNDHNIHSDKVIHHFPGGPGKYKHKIVNMNEFLNKLNKYNFINGTKIYDIKQPPKKNNVLPLIGICVSYNYFDTLQFMLPANYLHFEQIYVITQTDDRTTIDFCKKFKNVRVLFYNFKHDHFKFDKFGAINYAQKIVYAKYPNSWYLIIDSDIILPNNFIDILNKEELQSDCIYGAIRNNVLASSELLNKKNILNNTKNIKWVFNNILHWAGHPPSILGCFQLYKKHCFYRDNIDNTDGGADYYFGHDHFELFCNLENIVYFHLGTSGVNWSGKVVSFIDDIHLSITDLYYNCNKQCNNIYYDNNCQIIKYGDSKNINDDIWTCSNKMRKDVYDFFKNKPLFKIAEIGSHKGYSTKILSKIFSKVYAIDNNVEWTTINKEFNKNATNIEYIMLDIYINSWQILPDDIEVAFIDADHSYSGCKSDIMNSIKRFDQLQYIILDDYGVWSGVKQIVDELIKSRILIFERFIGIHDVPGPNGVITNTNEGIICRVNKRNIHSLQNKEKIFVIGYNKTATTSFHSIFSKNGLKSQHDTIWNTNKYDCFCDNGNLNNFKLLHTNYPNAIFILNIRILDEWLISRFKHGELYKHAWAYPATAELCIRWINEREKYYIEILEYFQQMPTKLIIVNIDNCNWIQYICEMFNFKNNNICYENMSNHINTTPENINIINIVNNAFNQLKYNKYDKRNILLKDEQLTKYYFNLYTNNVVEINEKNAKMKEQQKAKIREQQQNAKLREQPQNATNIKLKEKHKVKLTEHQKAKRIKQNKANIIKKKNEIVTEHNAKIIDQQNIKIMEYNKNVLSQLKHNMKYIFFK